MQNIIAEKLLNIVEVEQVEKEKSAFDEYDRENGYEDDDEEQVEIIIANSYRSKTHTVSA